MIEEIIYTSAQKGLKAGSRGFCTVVSTAGMALNTAERLESMSGYRHAFPMQDPRAQHNPVNFSHVALRIGGKNAHVISRVSDAGQDYSGRTNKLAHHLMLDDVSRFVAGPARLMVENGVFVTQWDGNVRNVPPRNLPVPILPKSVDLKAWKAATGDSGWAGWVAEQLMKDKAPVSVIFSAGTETLTLVREALDLLPPTQRWSVTYSTYFTKLLAGTECQLRFVLDDTPEATALRNDARARVVDLTKRLGAVEGGALVTQARNGHVQLGNSDMPEPPVPNRSQPQVQAESIRPAASAPARNEESVVSGGFLEIPTLNPRAPAIPFGSRSGPPDLFDKPIRKHGRRTWMLYTVGSLLLMLIASGVTYFVVNPMNVGHRGQVEATVVASKEPPRTKSESRFEVTSGANNVIASDNQGTGTGIKPATTPTVAPHTSDVVGKSNLVENMSNDAAAELKTPEAMADTSSPATSGTEVKTVEPAVTPDPFQVVLNNPSFKYPRHDLLLFKLSDSLKPAAECRMPLILQKGDEVTLALHAGFSDLVEGRFESGMKGDDFRLSPPTSRDDIREWKAEFFRDNESNGSLGVYKLSPVNSSDLHIVKSATHHLEFTAGNLFTSTSGTDREFANTFQMCPLLVIVKSKSGISTPKLFCQSYRDPHAAESRRGRWKPEFTNESNPLRGLAILNGSAASPWKMYFDVVTFSHEHKRTTQRFQFPEAKTTHAIGRLFSNIPDVEKTESDFRSNPKDADGECGYLQHDFLWQFEKEDGQTPNVAHHYSVTKDDHGVLRLPAMPDSQSEDTIPEEHRISARINKGNGAFNDTGWADSLDIQKHPELRLRTHSTSDDRFAENSKRLSDKIVQIKSALEITLPKMKTSLKELEETKPQPNDFNAKSQNLNAGIAEINSRIARLNKLIKEFDPDEHETQFKAFKTSQTRDRDRVIGYEIAIELKEQKIDTILYPATTIYLVETIFPDEQR